MYTVNLSKSSYPLTSLTILSFVASSKVHRLSRTRAPPGYLECPRTRKERPVGPGERNEETGSLVSECISVWM